MIRIEPRKYGGNVEPHLFIYPLVVHWGCHFCRKLYTVSLFRDGLLQETDEVTPTSHRTQFPALNSAFHHVQTNMLRPWNADDFL